jgi:elongation factor Ts
LHTTSALFSSKSDLAQLRKKTGYSLSICKKALSENNDDVALAEKWLREQAQAQGWAKAQKLQGRNTAQGLLGLRLQPSAAVLAELNCETDFVAKNKKFVSLLDLAAEASLKAVLATKSASPGDDFSSGIIQKEEAGQLEAEAGKSLADVVALNIGQLGENTVLGDVNYFTTKQGSSIRFAGFCHPNVEAASGPLLTGRYAAIVAYTCSDNGVLQEGQTTESLARICMQ